MRFALLGDHADGLEMARALANTGRHELTVYSGPPLGCEYLQRWGLNPRKVGDLEEVLADPKIEAVIVAGSPALRPGQLRRSLQSERHVLCIHPVDESPDLAYEAAMAQADAHKILFPLLPEALHPAFRRLAQLARSPLSEAPHSVPAAVSEGITNLPIEPKPLADPKNFPILHLQPMTARLVEVERWSAEEILLESEEEGHKPGFPGWELLRQIGGEIGEIYAMSGPDEVERGQPLLMAGQFVEGGLFQATYLPLQAEARFRVALVNREGRAELIFTQGWPGPAQLTFTDDNGQDKIETWGAFNPWEALVEEFEAALHTRQTGNITWQDAIRGLELDDAARRSIHRRRAIALDFQEVTEEAGFKGTMTLVGCSLMWISLVLLILSAWIPWLGWIIAPLIGIFLVLQLLRGVMPAGEPKNNVGHDSNHDRT